MPLILPGNVGSATAATGFNVANSCRFNIGSSDHLTRSLGGSPTSTRKATWSYWVKKAKLVAAQMIYSNEVADDNNRGYIQFEDNDSFRMIDSVSSTQLKTNRLFRDVGAFYHICFAIDTTQGTAANRIKLYVNGVQETSFATASYPSQNDDLKILTGGQTNKQHISKVHGGAGYFGGYLSEFVFIDGLALTPTDFGEFDEDSGIWKPIDVSGLTFGTNGFYLDFENSGALGADVSGNTNNFTVNNLTAIDQTTDTPTNNFATLNPLHSIGAGTELSQGNLEYDPAGHHRIISTIVPSSGKWYAEVKGIDNPDKFNAGVAHYPMPANGSASSFAFGQGVNADVGRFANDFGVKANGQYGNDNSYANYMASLEGENNNIVGIYLDLDNYKIYFSKNGTLVSSTGKDLTNNGEPYGFISVGEAATFQWNFGNPSFALANTAITDDNGFGAFEYSPNITGDSAAKSFFALCTKNLAEYG